MLAGSDGLARGMEVEAPGHPIQVPVGEATLGRMFNVLGQPIDQQGPVPEGTLPYDWDPVTGLSRRFVPGQPNGMHTLTGLAHDRSSRVAYDPEINEQGMHARSLKLAALQRMLTPPTVCGPICGWGCCRPPSTPPCSSLAGWMP